MQIVCETNNCGTNLCEWGLSWEKKNVNVIELNWKLLVFFTLMCLYLPCLNMKAPPVCVWVCWKWRWEKIISQKILNCGTNVCEFKENSQTLVPQLFVPHWLIRIRYVYSTILVMTKISSSLLYFRFLTDNAKLISLDCVNRNIYSYIVSLLTLRRTFWFMN